MLAECSALKRKAIDRDVEERLFKLHKSDDFDSSADREDTTKITDINTDCLEKIFKCLELGDLLNIVDTCKHFKEAAGIIVSRRFAKKSILINEIRVSRTRLIDDRNNFVILNDLKSIFQTLRSFGHLIEKMKVYGNDFANFTEETIEFGAKSIGILSYYIGHYCATSLTELIIKKGISLKLLKKPFLKVENVEINIIHAPRGQLNRNWFRRMFPNVRQLKYESVFGRNNFDCIVDHFPKLKHLNISYANPHCKNLFQLVSITDDECTTNNVNVMELLSLNPQLTSLALPYISDIEILRKISEHQQQLENLILKIQLRSEDSNHFNSSSVHFKSVKNLKIFLCKPNQRPDSGANEMTKIPFSFGNLEVLTIQTCFQYSEEFFNFIEKHKSITKLNLQSCSWPQLSMADINHQRLAAALPMLKDIHLMCYSLKVDDAIAFSVEFKQLKKFCFKRYLWDDYGDLVERLSNEWQINICSHGSFVTMERKHSE